MCSSYWLDFFRINFCALKQILSLKVLAGIGLDQKFGDFPIAEIALDTHALPASVAARGHYLSVPRGPKMILMSSRARRSDIAY
ncbi:unnamed protein product [Prunus armeniaca]